MFKASECRYRRERCGWPKCQTSRVIRLAGRIWARCWPPTFAQLHCGKSQLRRGQRHRDHPRDSDLRRWWFDPHRPRHSPGLLARQWAWWWKDRVLEYLLPRKNRFFLMIISNKYINIQHSIINVRSNLFFHFSCGFTLSDINLGFMSLTKLYVKTLTKLCYTKLDFLWQTKFDVLWHKLN